MKKCKLQFSSQDDSYCTVDRAALAAIAVDTPEPGVPPAAPDPAALQKRAVRI